MARDENINVGIWNEPEFFALSPHAKLVYIWSWTNTRCHFAGIYQVPRAAIALETKLTETDVTGALEELRQVSFVLYDGSWLWCHARLKRIKTRTVQMCKAVAKDLLQVPESHPFREQLMALEGHRVWHSKSDRFTLEDVMKSLSGGTAIPFGSDPPIVALEPKSGSHPGLTAVGPMTETKTVTRTSPQGRGSGRGRTANAVESPEKLSAERARREQEDEFCAHFPGVHRSFVMNAVRELTGAGDVASVEAVAAVLADERPAA